MTTAGAQEIEIVNCPRCHAENSARAPYCEQCREPLSLAATNRHGAPAQAQPKAKFCGNCGSSLAGQVRFCADCGTAASPVAQSASGLAAASPTLAALRNELATYARHEASRAQTIINTRTSGVPAATYLLALSGLLVFLGMFLPTHIVNVSYRSDVTVGPNFIMGLGLLGLATAHWFLAYTTLRSRLSGWAVAGAAGAQIVLYVIYGTTYLEHRYNGLLRLRSSRRLQDRHRRVRPAPGPRPSRWRRPRSP